MDSEVWKVVGSPFIMRHVVGSPFIMIHDEETLD